MATWAISCLLQKIYVRMDSYEDIATTLHYSGFGIAFKEVKLYLHRQEISLLFIRVNYETIFM